MAETVNASIIDLRILAAAVAFASKDETRYYLNGVCLEIDQRAVTYIATDGHRMIAYRDEFEDADTPDNLLVGKFIIPTAHCKPHKIGKDDDPRAKIFGTGRLTIAYAFCDITFLPIDGIYPDWRKTIPRGAVNGKLSQFNLEYLAAFRKFAVAADLPAPFVAHNGEGPAAVWFPGRDNALGIVMPIRSTDESGRVAPAWAEGGGDHEQMDIEDAVA